MLFAIDHSVCIWSKTIVNTETSKELVFSISWHLIYCLSALAIAMMLEGSDFQVTLPSRSMKNCVVSKRGQLLGSPPSDPLVLVSESNQIFWNQEKINPLHIFLYTEDKKTPLPSLWFPQINWKSLGLPPFGSSVLVFISAPSLWSTTTPAVLASHSKIK